METCGFFGRPVIAEHGRLFLPTKGSGILGEFAIDLEAILM
jgi:hypothetical protein